MLIQWYPGHMAKAVREMRESVKLVDAVLYVLDSRAIEASMNPKFEPLIERRRPIYVLNKCDLVNRGDLELWQKKFKAEGKYFAAVNSASGDTTGVIAALSEAMSDKVEKYAAKGVDKTIRAMVVGVPNSGKSTLINSLCGKKKTATGDRPGVTRGRQWVGVGKNIELLDTPGTLWASFDNAEHALDLAFIGSIRDDILDTAELACELIKKLISIAPGEFLSRYAVDISKPPHLILEDIAALRGFIKKGGAADIDRAAKAVLDDFRKGRTGKIMLEKP